MKLYFLGVILVIIGFLMPPLSGLEYGFTVIGGYIFFKKLNEDYSFEKR